MKCPRLKTIAVLVLFVYMLSIVITYYLLHNSHSVNDNIIKISLAQIQRHMKSHRRPEQLRIGHPLYKSCLQDDNYEKLLLQPYHTLGKVHVYSAFFDNRTGEPHVRMIAMINNKNRDNTFKLYCHFGYGSNQASYTNTPAVFYEMCENHHFSHGGWIISCEIPVIVLKHMPCEIFIKETDVSQDYKPSVMIPLLKTYSDQGTDQRKFGLCVPPLYGSITPSDVIRFMALSTALGVNHIIFYVYNITTELNDVLEYLEDRGAITIIPWLLPTEKNHIWYYGQSIAINDCLYRGMFYFKYLAFTDLDEYIVSHDPEMSLLDLMESKFSKNRKIAAFRFGSTFFIRNPTAKGNNTQLDVLNHIYRTEGVSKIRSKIIVEPNKIFEVGIHHVSRTWPDDKSYVTFEVDPEVAVVHHYRNCTPTLDLGCSSFITDSTIPDWHSYNFMTRYNSRMNELKRFLNITD